MNKKFGLMFCLIALALVISSLPAMAGDLYNNLGTGTNVYNCCTGWAVTGTGSIGTSFTTANEFTAAAGGNVSAINIGIGYVAGFGNSFFVSLDQVAGSGQPGNPLKTWTGLSSSEQFGQCCGLLSITGITGVSLTAGDSYYLVIGPSDVNGNTYVAFNWNSTGATGTEMYSNDGGSTWNNNGTQTIGAFEIVGGGGGTTPEPSSLLLLGTGVLGIVGTIRRKINL